MAQFGIGTLGLGLGQLGVVGGSLGPVSIATNSLSLASASSQSLTQTGKITINQQKFTISAWFKFASVGTTKTFLYFGDGTTSNAVTLTQTGANFFQFRCAVGGSVVGNLVTLVAFTDTASWHHLLVSADTTQAVANNRLQLWLDGAQPALGTNTQPAQNTNLANNFASTYRIGGNQTPANFFNGNLAQFYYIDGQQLTPTSFITGTPGVPKTYSGTFTGHFDFFLNFSNAGSLGTDSSGQGNNWTPQNAPTQSSDHP